jgi:hypothetical protein
MKSTSATYHHDYCTAQLLLAYMCGQHFPPLGYFPSTCTEPDEKIREFEMSTRAIQATKRNCRVCIQKECTSKEINL